MLTNDIPLWIDGSTNTACGVGGFVSTKALKELVAKRLGVSLTTNAVEDIDGITKECHTRRSTVVIPEDVLLLSKKDELCPYVEALCIECVKANIEVLKDVYCTPIVINGVGCFVCAVRGIWGESEWTNPLLTQNETLISLSARKNSHKWA